MDTLLYYSGAIGIAVMWVLMFIPSLRIGVQKTKYAMSYIGANHKFGKYFNLGIILSSFLQLLFLYSLSLLFSQKFVGLIIFSAGSVIGIASGFVNTKKLRKLHFRLGLLYFVLSSIGATIFSIEILNLHQVLSLTTLASIILLTLGSLYLFKVKKSPALAEYWIFTMSTVWTACFYLLV